MELDKKIKIFFSKISKEGQKGSTLVEILISMVILSFHLVGILQMFGAAFIINQRSATKTLQSYKCQQLSEVIRIVWNINRETGMLPPSASDSGIQFQNGFIGILPYNNGDQNWSFWGPAGANIVELPKAPYRLFYRIENDPTNNNLILTTTAVEAKLLNNVEEPYVQRQDVRRVEYVLQLQNN